MRKSYMAVVLISALTLAALSSVPSVKAQKKTTKPTTRSKRNSTRKRPMAVTPERQAHVMAFVEQHHPELQGLLVSLEKQDKRAYQRAMRDLFRTSERLINIGEKYPPERYELELKIWKAKSRSGLLATQFKVTKDEKTRQKLREVVNEQIDLQLELLRRERKRHLERLKKVEKQIQSLDKGRQRTIDRQVGMLTQDRRTKPKSGAGARKSRPSKVSTQKKRKNTKKNKPGQNKPKSQKVDTTGG